MKRSICNGAQSKIKPPTDSEGTASQNLSQCVSRFPLGVFFWACSPGWIRDAGKCLPPVQRHYCGIEGLQSQRVSSSFFPRQQWKLCIWSLVCALPSVQIESGYELNMSKLFTSSSPASLAESTVFIRRDRLCVCYKQGGRAQRKMENRNLFAELFKIKGGSGNQRQSTK